MKKLVNRKVGDRPHSKEDSLEENEQVNKTQYDFQRLILFLIFSLDSKIIQRPVTRVPRGRVWPRGVGGGSVVE